MAEQAMTWQQAHENLAIFARSRSGLELTEGRLLRAAFVSGAHTRLGFGSFAEYVERLFGYAPRLTREKLRVAEALESLPIISQALERGELTWAAVRELTRVTVPGTEAEWLSASHNRSVREVEEMVSGRRLGELPSDRPDPSLRRHVLRFEVSGETWATFGRALAALRKASGCALSDDDALLLMARCALGGPNDEGRASYQVELEVCPHCREATQLGNGTRTGVDSQILEMAECDAQHLPDARQGEKRASQSIPPALRRQVLRRDDGHCVVSGCRNSIWVDVHHLVARAEGGANEAENLVCLCGAHHRAVHAGTLLIDGTPSSGLEFRHKNGARYGKMAETVPPRATSNDATEPQVLGALKGLGFGEKEIHAAHASCRDALGAGASREDILRRCLETLSERALGGVRSSA